MRGAVRNKDRWERRRTPTQYPSTDLQAVVQQAKLCCFLWHVVPLQILGIGIGNPAHMHTRGEPSCAHLVRMPREMCDAVGLRVHIVLGRVSGPVSSRRG